MSIFGIVPAPAIAKAPQATETQKRTLRQFTHDGVIEASWRLRNDTATTARMLGLRESVVANRLAAIRDGRAN